MPNLREPLSPKQTMGIVGGLIAAIAVIAMVVLLLPRLTAAPETSVKREIPAVIREAGNEGEGMDRVPSAPPGVRTHAQNLAEETAHATMHSVKNGNETN